VKDRRAQHHYRARWRAHLQSVNGFVLSVVTRSSRTHHRFCVAPFGHAWNRGWIAVRCVRRSGAV
ncbi:MAG: hypothetical protein ACK55I_13985, partial [bacterium]